MRAMLAAMLIMLAPLAPLQNAPSATLTVSAAVSLTDVLTAAALVYTRAGGAALRFNFAASNVLARQIVSGAPVDLFISADEAQMNVVEAASLLRQATRIDLLTNQLAVVVPDDRRRTFTNIREIVDPAFRRIAIGDPAAVPAGVYAKRYLEQQGLWTTIAPRIVPSASVRAALSAVESGAADAAIVYRTDARAATRATVAWVVPRAEGPTIVYPAAIVRSSTQPDEAQRFLDFLRTPAAIALFEQFGFGIAR